jgi:excisionase family DNA binding protein
VIPSAEEQPTLTVEEAGAALGISRSAMYRSVHRGEVPILRIGGRIAVLTAPLRRQLGLDVVEQHEESP